jgi:PKD repeat protein
MANLLAGHRTLYVALTLLFGLLCFHFIVTPNGKVRAQGDPTIQHSAIECLPNNQHAICSAVITPGVNIQTARVYFRSDKYPDFYYVEMTGDGDDFQAVFPIPSEETDRVIYYVEAVTGTYDTGRTAEIDTMVASESECRRRDAAVMWWTGGDPGIVIGATVDGAPAIPPGFQALGITGFVTAAGVTSSAGGGIGTGAAIGIGAGVAAGAGVGIAAATGGDASTTTTVVAGGGSSTTTTTAPATSTTTATAANDAPRACFTMEPEDGKLTEGDAIRLDARCSEGDRSGGGDTISNYEWDLGDGRTRSGPDQAFITPRYNTPGVYTITLTVTDSGGSSSSMLVGLAQSSQLQDSISKEITVSASPVTACFAAAKIGFCSYRFDASCSTGDISRYDWVLDTQGTMSGPYNKSGRVVTQDFMSCPGSIVVSLTVTGEAGQSDTTSKQVTVTYLTSPFQKDSQISTAFNSFLSVPPFDGGARGFVTMNNIRTFTTNNSAPSNHAVQGRLGENEIEAYLATPIDTEGAWRFDFSGASGFVAGSIKVKSGQVISIDSRSVVFRLSGAPGERIKFTYKLLP